MSSTDDPPSKSEIFDYWKDRFRDLGIFVDWGEPGCWACGFHYGTKYDIKRSNASWNEILRCWEGIPLQRCHIIPRSLGGTTDPPNMFLMCRECHDLAPNTDIPEIFFEWVRAQSWRVRESSRTQAAFASFGVDSASEKSLCELIDSDKFKSWVSGRFGLHWPQSKYAALSHRLTPATLIGLAVHYERTHRTNFFSAAHKAT